MSPQADYVVSNGTGAAVRSDINGQLAAIVSNNSGASAPATTYAYMLWADTSTNLLKLRNGANSAWITVGDLTAANLGLATLASPTFTGTATIPTLTVSTVANIPLGSAASPTLYFTGDSNTGLYSPGADQVALSTGGTGRLFIDSSGRCGIGTSSPASTLHSVGTTILGTGTYPTGSIGLSDARTAILSSTENQILIIGNTNATVGADKGAEIYLGAKATTGSENLAFAKIGGYKSNATSGNFESHLAFSTSNSVGTSSEKVRIDSSGRVGIGTTSPGTTLHLSASSPRFRLEDSDGGYAHIESDGGNLFLVSDNGASQANSFLALGVDGTERARIDSSGRLLVGTSTANGTNQLQIEGSLGSNISLRRGEAPGNITSGEFIGGIEFQDNAEHIFGIIECRADANAGTNDYPGRLVFSTTADGASSPTERMRIDNLGRSMINQTSVTDFAALSISFNSGASSTAPATGLAINQTNASTGTIVGFRNSSGTVIGSISNNNNGTITYNNSSDYRLKENIIDLDGAINRLQTIPVRRFNFIGFPDKTVDGFVAHEIQNVVPEAVTGTKDAVDDEGNPIYQGIDQSKLVPLLTAALQEAVAKIESLEARLTTAGI